MIVILFKMQLFYNDHSLNAIVAPNGPNHTLFSCAYDSSTH